MEPKDFTLLVVDDNEMNRDMLSRRLQRRGYGIHVAEDGARALAIIDEKPVDLVLLDIMMPGIDGIEVLERLRRTYSQAELPIIMATAKADSEDVVKALELGANDYVTKPIDFPVVLARVQTQLRTKTAAATAPPPAPAKSEPTAADIAPGAVLAEKYRLDEMIGSGNFGAVYRARHLDLDYDVAVKILLPSVTASEESTKRFRQEGVAACRVRHPNAVAVMDSGVTEGGVAYLVMELLEGTTLVDEMKRRGRIPPERCLEILKPVCEVLAVAHDAGLVHRDIKPENIFLNVTPRGEEIKVLDFGIAKLVGESVAQDNLTAEGWILGTPAYIAPERVNAEDYDGRSDVYGLGILLFEMLAGRRPFQTMRQDPMGLLMMHVNAEPPALRSIVPELSAELEHVVASAIRKKPAERPDARQLSRALERAIAPAPQAGPGPRPGAQRQPAASLLQAVRAGTIDPHASTVELAAPKKEEDEGAIKRWLKKVAGPRT